jgi:hypothetical protein
MKKTYQPQAISQKLENQARNKQIPTHSHEYTIKWTTPSQAQTKTRETFASRVL